MILVTDFISAKSNPLYICGHKKTDMKKNVDCEIYISGLINFFDKNPNDLKNLIGELDKEKFYMQLRIAVYKNFDNGEDVVLTQQQILDILVKFHGESKRENLVEVLVPIHKTKWGDLNLN
jgi:hypothetical protein